jgi:hypothetical protein
VLLGHASRLLQLPVEILYIAASALGTVLLAFALYCFAATFLERPGQRKLAFLLVLAIGPDWVLRVARLGAPGWTWLARYDQAFNRPEVATLYLFNTAPHLALALAILLAVVAFENRRQSSSERLPATQFAVYYLLLPLLLGLLNPFSLPTLVVPLAAWWMVRSVRARRPLVRDALPLAAMCLAILPVLIYNWWTFSRDPLWGNTYGAQNIQFSFPPDMVLLGYGLVGILAIAGVLKGWRNVPGHCMLAIWAAVVLLLGYLPVTYQRRFSLGLAPALAVLAATGWHWAARSRPVRWLRRRAVTRVLGSAALVLLVWGQSIFYYVDQTRSFAATGSLSHVVFQPQSLAAAVPSIDAWGDQTIVLTCEEIGNLLAGEFRGRVVLGHPGATLNVAERRREVGAFFAGQLAPSEQRELLRKHRVTHILTSTVEHYLCGPDYVPGPEWSLGFSQGGITVFVTRAEGSP